MANMSYCRFENTLIALQDCSRVVQDALLDGVSFEELADELGADELKALVALYKKAIFFTEMMDDLTGNSDEGE